MRRLSLVLAAALLSACAVKSPGPVVTPPPVPKTYQLFVHACDGEPCVAGDETHKLATASVRVNDDVAPVDGAGNRIVDKLVAGVYRVCALATGYVDACTDVTLPPANGSADVFLLLKPDAPPVLSLRVDGKVFRDSTGAIWQYRGATSFLLLQRYIHGDNIVPYLDARRAAGANLVRVLSTVTWGPIAPTDYTDEQLRGFLQLVHSRGLRVELVALASAENWPIDKQRAHVQRIVDVVASAGALDLVEVANEPFQNSAPPVDVMRGVRRAAGVLMAYGDYSVNCSNLVQPVLDYLTFHPERKDEWPRTAKDAVELRDGFGCKDADGNDAPGFGGTHVPVVSDEPMGAAENNEPGRRSNVATDFYWFGTTAALLGAGSTFHSEDGLRSIEPHERQALAERAFFDGLKSVSADAQLGQYTRGGLTSAPLDHDNDTALRLFCSLQGGRADCVVIRPTPAWTPIARGGWRIVERSGPAGTRLVLAR